MRRLLTVVGLFLSVAGSAEAQERRRVGPWEITIERNRFEDGNDVIVAMQMRQGLALAIRCLQDKQFSFGLIELGLGTGRLRRGMQTSVLVRVDQNPVERPLAGVVSDRLVQINFPIDKADQLLRGREIAIRLEIDGGAGDHVFRLTQADRALAPVIEACRGPSEPDRAEASGTFGLGSETLGEKLRAIGFTTGGPLTFTCKETLEDTRFCEAQVQNGLTITARERHTPGSDLTAFKAGKDKGSVDTIAIHFLPREVPTATPETFRSACSAALRVVDPQTSAQRAGSRIDALLRDARAQRRREGSVVALGAGSGHALEIEISRSRGQEDEVYCSVLAKR